MAKSKLGTQKRKTWIACSKYVRTRDCLKTTGSPEYGRCYTCGGNHHITKLDAGHFLPGRRNSILFDTRGIHAQCTYCNHMREGATLEYLERMLADHGQDVVDELRRLDKSTRKYTVAELAELEAEFKRKTEELLQKEGVLI